MRTILLADDEENLRILVNATLDDATCEIVEAPDGVEALRLARELRPSLIVIDWMMPGMTGREVSAALRADPETATIPIILLTAKGQESDRALGLAAGVNAYLTRPFSPLQLLDTAAELLEP